MSIGTLLLIILILLLVGALPTWPHSKNWGYYPGGGLDLAFILNYADNYKGVKWGFINYTKQDALGWDPGFVNYISGTARGLYTGVVNYAARLKGVGLGLVNYVDSADSGVQIGIVNIIKNNKTWFSDLPNSLAPVMIFVNWRFNTL